MLELIDVIFMAVIVVVFALVSVKLSIEERTKND